MKDKITLLVGHGMVLKILDRRAHDHSGKKYIKYLLIKKTMGSISIDNRRGVKEYNRDQMPKLCNVV